MKKPLFLLPLMLLVCAVAYGQDCSGSDALTKRVYNAGLVSMQTGVNFAGTFDLPVTTVPTLTITAPFMSPEQAQGKTVL